MKDLKRQHLYGASRARLPLNFPTLSIFLTSILLFSFFIYQFCKHPEVRIRFDKNRARFVSVDDEELYHAVNFWNQSLNTCKWPILNPHEPEILPYVNYFRTLHCTPEMPSLASLLDNGYLLITTSPDLFERQQVPALRCTVAPLSGGLTPEITKYEMEEEKEVPINKAHYVGNDQFVVRCYNETLYAFVDGKPLKDGSLIYERNFVNFAGLFDKIKPPKSLPTGSILPFGDADSLNPSIVILVLESTSLNQFRRHAPETLAFLQEHDFVTMNMYNKIADNSAVNLFPILTGRPIQMDPDNPDPEDTFVDLENVTFLWDLMKRRGCVTMMNDDIADVRRGLFHYPNHTFTGFPVSPTDFYLRPTHLFNTKHRISSGKTCLNDGTSLAAEYLSYMRHFSSAFKDACHFSFNFITSLTHDDPSMLGTIDQELKRALESLFAQDIEKSTTFVIMGDHGNRIHQIQRTTTGRVEERSPLFSIRLPDEWKRKNAKAHKNLRTNANRLVTNFDLHKTLRHLALSGREDLEPPKYGVNLFSQMLNSTRGCEEAEIPENFCLCMEQQENKSLRLTNETDVYKKLFASLSERILSLPCVKSIRPHFRYPTLEVFSLNQMVLHGLRHENQWDSVKNYTSASDFEWIELGMIADMHKRYDGFELSFGLIARYRHRLSTDLYELSESPRVHERTAICNAPTVDEICEMCYYDNLVSARNEQQVI